MWKVSLNILHYFILFWSLVIRLPHHQRVMFNILYPFHIKPIMRSQRHFENNAVWSELRFKAALSDSGVRKAAFYVGSLLLPREVFWKRILAKSRSLRQCGCQCERVHRIMWREGHSWTASCMDGKHPISLNFFKPHAKMRRTDARCESKPNRTGV